MTPLTHAEQQALFDRNVDPALREAAKKRTVALALAGDGLSAFYLGVLYRHGMRHPAQLVERDIDTARHWLQVCVDSARCPVIALASLAELELDAQDARAAMQWAQAWVVIDRELNKRQLEEHPRARDTLYSDTAYQAYLLTRCHQAMGPVKDPDAMSSEWFTELRRQRGKQLDRMFFAALEGHQFPGDDPLATAENQRRKEIDSIDTYPKAPAYGLYLYEARPEGGRSMGLWVIEALPSPSSAKGLDLAARSVRTIAYANEGESTIRFAHLPMSFSNGEYSMTPAK